MVHDLKDLIYKGLVNIYLEEVFDLNLVDYYTMENLSKRIKEVNFKVLAH